MKNIVLIGMPGAGKSTVGVVLAKAMHMRFLDTDLSVQERMGECLQDTINREGKEGFLKIENEVLSTIHVENTVIATGGSVVYEPKAMAHLSQLGTVVYLKLGYKALARRLGNLEKRGVVLRPGQTLRMLYDERVPLYEKYANITVDCGGQDIEHTLRRVRRALEKQGNVTK